MVDDAGFYGAPRFVTHIDEGAVRAVQELYDELGVPDGHVLDLMSSWVSHMSRRPDGGFVVLGMNAAELAASPSRSCGRPPPASCAPAPAPGATLSTASGPAVAALSR